MLPKPLYESLPYFCLVTGAISCAFPTDLLQAISGIILYLAGAAIWIMRSENRRQDAPDPTLSSLKHSYMFWLRNTLLPGPAYEVLPFLYALAGILLLAHSGNLPAQGGGFLLLSLGLILFSLRHFNRTSGKESPQSRHIDM